MEELEFIGPLVKDAGAGALLIIIGVYILLKAKVKGAPISTVITENVLATVLVLAGVFTVVWGLVFA